MRRREFRRERLRKTNEAGFARAITRDARESDGMARDARGENQRPRAAPEHRRQLIFCAEKCRDLGAGLLEPVQPDLLGAGRL